MKESIPLLAPCTNCAGVVHGSKKCGNYSNIPIPWALISAHVFIVPIFLDQQVLDSLESAGRFQAGQPSPEWGRTALGHLRGGLVRF